MFHVTPEGESFRNRNGFHFYPWSDRISFGFRFRWNKTVRFFRLSLAKWKSQRTLMLHFPVIRLP